MVAFIEKHWEENFGGKNFDKSIASHKIHETFKFYANHSA